MVEICQPVDILVISIAVTCSRDAAVLCGYEKLSFARICKHCGLKTSDF